MRSFQSRSIQINPGHLLSVFRSLQRAQVNGIVLVIILACLMSGCQKDGLDVVSQDRIISQPGDLAGSEAGCPTPWNAEDLAELSYRHVRYWQATVDPVDYLPATIRSPFRTTYDSLMALVDQTSVSSGMQSLVQMDLITPILANWLEAYAASPLPAMSTIADLHAHFQVQHTNVSQHSSLTCAEKVFLHTFLDIQEQMARALHESWPDMVMRADCGGFWQQLGCILSGPALYLGSVIGGVVGAAVLTGGGIIGVTAAGGILLGPAAGIGQVVGIVIALPFALEACACDDCSPVLGLSFDMLDCGPNGIAIPWGMGKDISQIEWFNDNGLPEYAITYPPTFALEVSQVLPLPEYLTSTLKPKCEEEEITQSTAINDLYELSKTVEVTSILGETQVLPELGTYDYVAYGLGVDPNRYTYSFHALHGTILSVNGPYVSIQWDDTEDWGAVQVTVHNICSNRQRTFELRVDFDGGGML